MNNIEILVTITGIIMPLSYFIQAYRIQKTKDSHGVSVMSFLLLAIGMIIWAYYGITINNLPVTLSYIFGVLGTGTVMLLAMKYRK